MKVQDLARGILRVVIGGVMLLSTFDSAHAYPIYRYGLIDSNGREILPCIYSDIRDLGNGLVGAVVSKDQGSSGVHILHLFDVDGKELPQKLPAGSELLGVFIPKSALKSSSYSPGNLPAGSLMEIEYRNIRTVADLDGNILFDSPSITIQRSQDNSLVVLDATGPICAFDGETGKKVIDTKVLKHYMLSQSGFGKVVHNRILYSAGVDGKLLWGYYDADGNVAIQPKYTAASDFDEAGMAPVRYVEENGERCFRFIDTSGRPISPSNIIAADKWHDDLAVVQVKTEKSERRFGIVNRQFDFVVKPEWWKLSYNKTDSYFARKREHGETWQINSKGKRVGGPLLQCIAYNPVRELMIMHPGEVRETFGSLALIPHEDARRFFEDGRYCGEWMKDGMAVFTERGKRRRMAVNTFLIVTKAGTTASGIKAYDLRYFSTDRLLKEVVYDKFRAPAWKNDLRDRMCLFSLLLRDHNLIGMKRSEVEALIGPADDRSFYSMCPSMAADYGYGIELRYQDEAVTGWRWLETIKMKPHRLPWVTTNVTFDFDAFDVFDPEEMPLKSLKLVEKK